MTKTIMAKCYGCREEYEYSALDFNLMCEECNGEESKWDRKIHDDSECEVVE